MAAATAGLAAAAFPKVALGGLAAAALSSLAPSPPAPPSSLRKPVAPGLEGGPVPLNTHGVGKAGKLPPFEGERRGGCQPVSTASQCMRSELLCPLPFLCRPHPGD